MPKRDTHRVMSHQDGWQVKRDGGKRPCYVTETQKEAERLARAISQHQGTELQIHSQDMKIQRSDSHGRDPCLPKDKR